jgi:hypothetical protein
VKELGELWLEKDPRLSLVHLCVCAGGKVPYRRRTHACAPGVFLITGAQLMYSPGIKISLEGVGRAHLIPAALSQYSPAVRQVPLAHRCCMRRG